ncbi:hypothetical protein [Rhodoblastus acidophilus]|uniref:hypothetical protein n=1 Tax=Rhodoblastus acidophilus TaxID=1074 RepID=UPI0011315342|nr:hypothetical protein [Rhodoblastus acidophilus]
MTVALDPCRLICDIAGSIHERLIDRPKQTVALPKSEPAPCWRFDSRDVAFTLQTISKSLPRENGGVNTLSTFPHIVSDDQSYLLSFSEPALRRFQSGEVDNPLWLEAFRENWTGWRLSQTCESRGMFDGNSPFWSFDRFSRTSTRLPDGRLVHVAGEHED